MRMVEKILRFPSQPQMKHKQLDRYSIHDRGWRLEPWRDDSKERNPTKIRCTAVCYLSVIPIQLNKSQKVTFTTLFTSGQLKMSSPLTPPGGLDIVTTSPEVHIMDPQYHKALNFSIFLFQSFYFYNPYNVTIDGWNDWLY